MSQTRCQLRSKIRSLLICLSLLTSAAGSATVANWPSSTAPCNTTLQACINGTPGPSTIRIAANAPVTVGRVDLYANQSLVGDPVSRPRIRNGQITIYAGSPDFAVSKPTVENLILEESSIYVGVGLDEYVDTESVILSGLTILNTTTSPAILVMPTDYAPGSARSVTIQNSDITAPAALRVGLISTSDSLHLGFYNNIVRSNRPTTHPAINWMTMRPNASLWVTGNRFETTPGNGNVAVAVSTSDTPIGGASAWARIERNVIVGFDTPIQTRDHAGNLQLYAWHNSLSRFLNGIAVQTGGVGTFSFDLRNNILANGTQAIALSPNSSSFPELTRSRNLYYAVGTPSIGFEGNASFGNPLFQSSSNLRLQTGSTAIDQGDASIAAQRLRSDFDGVIGTRGVGPDIGAFEWTNAASVALTSSSATIFGNTMAVPTPVWNPGSGDIGFMQRVIDGDGAPLPADANKQFGIYRTAVSFRLFTEDQSPFPNNARFLLLKPGTGSFARDVAFVHRAVNESGNPNNNVSWHMTTLPSSQFPGSLGSLERIAAQIAQRWDPPGGLGTYNNHAIGVYRTGDTYTLFNQDWANMPNGAGFHVLTPTTDVPYAFQLNTTATATAIPLRHPLLTNNPCAHVYVSANWRGPSGVYLPSALPVRFDRNPDGTGAWYVVRGDGQAFPANTLLNVYIDPEIANRCRETVF